VSHLWNAAPAGNLHQYNKSRKSCISISIRVPGPLTETTSGSTVQDGLFTVFIHSGIKFHSHCSLMPIKLQGQLQKMKVKQ
jgi:hypothetical protein